MTRPIESFQDHFNDVIKRVQRFAIFVRGKEFQEDSLKTLEELLSECTTSKDRAIAEQLEDDANAYLAFEYMTKLLSEEFRFYLALKVDDPDAAWDHLINAQSAAAAAIKSHAVASHLDKYIGRLHALERLLFPQPMFFSAGLIVRESECNICGAEYGECNHIKGRPYMGKLCTRIVKNADVQEVSIVSDPADKHCRAFHYAENGIERNVFTQRLINKEDAQQSPAGDVLKAAPEE